MRTDNPKPWLRLAGLIVLALLLAAAVAWRALDLSGQYGRLSVPPLYDDVSYFLGAANWLNAAGSQSAAAAILALLRDHAPFSALLAAIGFRLVPDGYAGPYIVNAVVVFAFLLGIIRLTWKHATVDIVTCLVGAACVPYVWHTITEARPDMPWGLGIGLAAGAIAHRGVLQRSLGSLVALGIACGLAVSIKPTAFPASLVCLGSVFVIRLSLDCVQSGGLRASMRRAGTVLLYFSLALLATTAVLIGPALLETIGYILQVFGKDRDLWNDGKGFWFGLLRFGVGGEGRLALNGWFWAGLVLIAIRLALAARNGRAALQETSVMVAAVAIAYAIPSLAEIKTYFFGTIFYGVFIVAMTQNYCDIQARVGSLVNGSLFGDAAKYHLLLASRALPLAAVALLVIYSVVAGHMTLVFWLTAQQQEDIRAGTARVWSILREAKPDASGMLGVGFSSPYPVTPSTIQLYAVQADMRLAVRQDLFHRTVEATEAALLQSNFQVIASSIPHNLPGPRQGDELIQRMDANKDVCLLDSLSFPDVRLRIYRRGPC